MISGRQRSGSIRLGRSAITMSGDACTRRTVTSTAGILLWSGSMWSTVHSMTTGQSATSGGAIRSAGTGVRPLTPNLSATCR